MLCEIASDITFGFMVSSGDYGTSGIPVIKTKDIKSKRVTYPAEAQKINTKLDQRYEVNRGDLLIVLGGSPGENGIWEFDEKAWLNQDCAKITIQNCITKKYVFYMLESVAVKSYVISNTTKTTIGHISRDVVRNIPIPLPSLERQQQIVEAIDGWTVLAQQEEHVLKSLEKQMMFQVKEMGRGKERVKLGEVCEIRNGKGLTKEDLTGGDVPVIGGGVSPMGYHNTHNKEEYTVVLAQVGANAGNVSRYPVKSWITNNGMTIHPKGTGIANDDILYYILKNIQDDIKGYAEGTAQPKLNASSVLSLTVQIPLLAEQQTLQSDFDEIRHKHAKIAYYKAKAADAIKSLIPGAA
jgi:restriction endonuclease S subunit